MKQAGYAARDYNRNSAKVGDEAQHSGCNAPCTGVLESNGFECEPCQDRDKDVRDQDYKQVALDLYVHLFKYSHSIFLLRQRGADNFYQFTSKMRTRRQQKVCKQQHYRRLRGKGDQ